MGDVVLITANALRRVETVIRDKLTSDDSISQVVARLPVDVKTWRAAARRVAKSLARPTWTGLDPRGQVVWAELADWPATPEEEIRQRAAMGRAILGLPDIA